MTAEALDPQQRQNFQREEAVRGFTIKSRLSRLGPAIRRRKCDEADQDDENQMSNKKLRSTESLRG